MKIEIFDLYTQAIRANSLLKKSLGVIFSVLIITAFSTTDSYAWCTNLISSQTIYYGTIVVQRDTPVGSAVSGVIYGPEDTVAKCDDPTGTGENSGILVSLSAHDSSYYGNQVFNTYLNGIGVTIGIAGGFYSKQWDRWVEAGNNSQADGTINGSGLTTFIHQTKIQFIKTSAVAQSGTFTQQIGSYRPAEGSIGLFPSGKTAGLIPVYATGNIVVVACSITTPNLTFPIGNVLASNFGTSVGTIPSGAQNTQTLGLNCDAGANINVTLSGTNNPDVTTTSVLALTNQGAADVAKGVGVQILYNGSPLVLNNKIVLKKSNGGQETFPITARYYQTKTSVSTGKANASATLNLTYQ